MFSRKKSKHKRNKRQRQQSSYLGNATASHHPIITSEEQP
jgi:hypothetical protein